ncbi:hypothetical protein BCV69DRAFT_127571 [Microstroma glucosiphilum]|uniref:Uncharacterized protein n=1 Tax=Pseudomicrostroma glucosiphilum TaxID=1684307 RepID=A0A316TW19_9BASI|nr:hypothetical protein BCV69DRAFT_127571 [Pseudomicrostroma glucosiphilum]PWN17722.1 hypothetical protein BCV69DRAFT_127571 [Pseudomicrostroma glucosiphilum]
MGEDKENKVDQLLHRWYTQVDVIRGCSRDGHIDGHGEYWLRTVSSSSVRSSFRGVQRLALPINNNMERNTSTHPRKADKENKAAPPALCIEISEADLALLSETGKVARERRGKTSATEDESDAAKRPGVPQDAEPSRVVKESRPRLWLFLLSPDGKQSPMLIWALGRGVPIQHALCVSGSTAR